MAASPRIRWSREEACVVDHLEHLNKVTSESPFFVGGEAQDLISFRWSHGSAVKQQSSKSILHFFHALHIPGIHGIPHLNAILELRPDVHLEHIGQKLWVPRDKRSSDGINLPICPLTSLANLVV